MISRYPASRIVTGPSPAGSGTTLVVIDDDGDVFPTPPFTALVWPVQQLPRVGTNACYVDVTAVDGDTLEFIRELPTVEINPGLMIAVSETVPVVAEGSAYHVSSPVSAEGPFTLEWQEPTGSIGSATNLDSMAGTIIANRGGIWRYAFVDGAGMVADDGEFFAQFTAVD